MWLDGQRPSSVQSFNLAATMHSPADSSVSGLSPELGMDIVDQVVDGSDSAAKITFPRALSNPVATKTYLQPDPESLQTGEKNKLSPKLSSRNASSDASHVSSIGVDAYCLDTFGDDLDAALIDFPEQ